MNRPTLDSSSKTIIKTRIMSDINEHLHNVLKQRENKMGVNGNHTFVLTFFYGPSYVSRIEIPGLNRDVARNMFDLFDEHNAIKEGSEFKQVSIQILDENEKEIDLNFLPNLHTKKLIY